MEIVSDAQRDFTLMRKENAKFQILFASNSMKAMETVPIAILALSSSTEPVSSLSANLLEIRTVQSGKILFVWDVLKDHSSMIKVIANESTLSVINTMSLLELVSPATLDFNSDLASASDLSC